MKLTFEGTTYNQILTQMADMLAEHAPNNIYRRMSSDENKNVAAADAQGPGPQGPDDGACGTVGEIPEKSRTSPTVAKQRTAKQRTAKQLENDERLRLRAKAKKDAGLKPFAKAPKPMPPEVREAPPPATAESLGLAPDEVVKVRQKTIEDLQSAYANGFQKEVFELLSRFGNGAKSFRELPPESFVPIREAIDNGALT